MTVISNTPIAIATGHRNEVQTKMADSWTAEVRCVVNNNFFWLLIFVGEKNINAQ